MDIGELGDLQLPFLETERHGYRLRLVRQNQIVYQCTSIGATGKIYQYDTARLVQPLCLLRQQRIDHIRKSSRTGYRQSGGTGKADVPTMVLACILHGRFHVLPGDTTFVSSLVAVRIPVFVFHRYQRFIPLGILQCNPTSNIVIPTVALGTGIVLQDTVAMHEQYLSSTIAQSQVILEVVDQIRSQRLVVQAGSSQPTIGFRIPSFFLQGYEQHFGWMLFQEFQKSRKHIRFPIDVLELDTVIDTQLAVIASLQTDIEATYSRFQLFTDRDILRLQRFSTQQCSTIVRSRYRQPTNRNIVCQTFHPSTTVQCLCRNRSYNSHEA